MKSIRIEQLSPEALRALADGDLAAAQELTDTLLTPYLVTDHPRSVWARRATQVLETPDDLPWVTGVLVDAATGEVVGAGGFHAAPDLDGMVEAGYGVEPAHQRRGYGRATLQALIDRAEADPGARVFRLTISPDNAASIGLALQFPFVEVGEQWDEDDGLETIYEMPVSGER